MAGEDERQEGRADGHRQAHGQAAFDRALADALVATRALAADAHAQALTEQLIVGGSLGLVLWELGLVDPPQLSVTGADVARLPLAACEDIERGAPQLGNLIPDAWRIEAGLVPFRRDGRQLLAASCWPWRVDRIDELGFRTGLRVVPHYLSDVELMQLLARLKALGIPRRYVPRPLPAFEREALAPPSTGGRGAELLAGPELIDEAEFHALHGGTAAHASAAPPLHSAPDDGQEDAEEIELTEPVDATAERPFPSREAALAALDRAWTRHAIGEVLLRFGRSRAARVALFSCREGVWLGWTGCGPGIDRERLAQLMVPIVPKTVFGLVHQMASPYVGPLPQHPVHRSFLAALGAQEPASAGIFPIYHRGRLLFVIYLDGGHGQHISPDVSDMLIVAQRVPSALERMVAARTS